METLGRSVQRERERERVRKWKWERGRGERERESGRYIYIYIERERERGHTIEVVVHRCNGSLEEFLVKGFFLQFVEFSQKFILCDRERKVERDRERE